MAIAVSEQRSVVTCNFSDYIALHEKYTAEGREHFGIILSTEEPTSVLINRLLRLLYSVTADDLKNQIRWLNEFR